MLVTDPNILEYLHDATVFEIVYNCVDTSKRTVVLIANAAPDAGVAFWDGKQLCIRLESVVLLSFSAFGAIVGEETIDSWSTTVSKDLEAELQRLQACGIDCSGVRFSVVFHSGSLMQGLCKRITIEVMAARV